MKKKNEEEKQGILRDDRLNEIEEKEEILDQVEKVKDHFHFIYLLFAFLGVGFLFPYNSLLMALDYYQLLYPNKHVGFLFSAAYMYPLVFFVILALIVGIRMNPSRIVIVGFICFTIVSGLMTSIAAESVPEKYALDITLAAVALVGCLDALVQSSLFSIAANFPMQYTQAIMFGNGVSGIVVSIMRISTRLAFGQGEEGLLDSTIIFYASGTAVVLLCLVFFLFRKKNTFYSFYDKSNNIKEIREEETKIIIRKEEEASEIIDEKEEEIISLKFKDVIVITKQILPSALISFLAFAITLSVYPGLAV